MFKTIFGVKQQQAKITQSFQPLNEFNATFYNGDVASNDVVNACIDCIARHCSKFEILHKKYMEL